MLVVGHVGWGPALHLTKLTPDEQYSHISLWCLLSAPLLIGCDMDRLDPFTLGLLSNDEVLAVDQDALGKPAVRVGTVGAIDVLRQRLSRTAPRPWASSIAPARPRRSPTTSWAGSALPASITSATSGGKRIWTTPAGSLKLTVPGHGVVLLKLTRVS